MMKSCQLLPKTGDQDSPFAFTWLKYKVLYVNSNPSLDSIDSNMRRHPAAVQTLISAASNTNSNLCSCSVRQKLRNKASLLQDKPHRVRHVPAQSDPQYVCHKLGC